MALASTATARRSPRTAIFCGAPQPLSTVDFDPQPWSVRFLPLQDTPPPAVRRTKSNGCGSKVHTAAIPNEAGVRLCGSYAELTGAVVALDDKYVPQVLKPILKSRREGCGCLRSPVGCAVCGNPLGTLIVHCTIHTHLESSSTAYEFAPSAVSPSISAESPPGTAALQTHGDIRPPDSGVFRTAGLARVGQASRPRRPFRPVIEDDEEDEAVLVDAAELCVLSRSRQSEHACAMSLNPGVTVLLGGSTYPLLAAGAFDMDYDWSLTGLDFLWVGPTARSPAIQAAGQYLPIYPRE
ncbi:hypothetical protein B0H14DRAFT_2770282 [Mycena olivaceomarginata]|nr:hypothetical protein B0H14DRAFT_2770282 [Mycena olivaceomarginata]